MTTLDTHALLSSSPARTVGGSTSPDVYAASHTHDGAADDPILRLQPPRSLPPWVSSYQRRYGPISKEQLRLLQPPTRIVQRQSNFAPSDPEPERRVSRDGFIDWYDPKLGPANKTRSRIPHFLRYGRASNRGRKWDHLRSAEPVIVSQYRPVPPQGAISWHDFVRSSSWGRMTNEESHIVDYETLNKLQPTFNSGIKVQYHHFDGRAKDNRSAAHYPQRIWNAIMRHPLSPLIFRLAVMITSVLALGLSARIYQLEIDANETDAERTQSVVAVVVDCVAIPYIGYMMWDEFTGKPLGLRSAMSKVSLILLDLFFIIFKSASTTLAFETLIYHGTRQASSLTNLSKALAAFQFLGLLSWSMTFAVNVFRMVKRLGGARGGGDDKDDSHM
ncbi:hypothetical protein E4U59_001801 [Claviceps monticola]|nr:hypothetical protein E4U59_001801 [Claviceps monticola]